VKFFVTFVFFCSIAVFGSDESLTASGKTLSQAGSFRQIDLRHRGSSLGCIGLNDSYRSERVRPVASGIGKTPYRLPKTTPSFSLCPVKSQADVLLVTVTKTETKIVAAQPDPPASLWPLI
jgi:hypothetical protein